MNDMLIDILTATLYYMSNIKIETLYEKLTYWSNQQHFEKREFFFLLPQISDYWPGVRAQYKTRRCLV